MYSVYSVYLGLVLVNYITSCMYLHTLTSICSLPINLKVVSISICEHHTANPDRRVLRQVSYGLGRNIYQMLVVEKGVEEFHILVVTTPYGVGKYTLTHPCIQFQGLGHPRARFGSSLWSRRGTGLKTLWDGLYCHSLSYWWLCVSDSTQRLLVVCTVYRSIQFRQLLQTSSHQSNKPLNR